MYNKSKTIIKKSNIIIFAITGILYSCSIKEKNFTSFVFFSVSKSLINVSIS